MMSRMLSARASAPGPPPGAGEAAPPARFAAEPPRLPRVVLAVRTHLCAGGGCACACDAASAAALCCCSREGGGGSANEGGAAAEDPGRCLGSVGETGGRGTAAAAASAAAPDDEFAAASRRRLADAPGGPRAGPGGAFDEGAAVAGGTAAAVAAAFASAEAAPGRATGRPLARGVNLGAKLLLRRFPARTGTTGEGGEEGGGREGSAGQRARAGSGGGGVVARGVRRRRRTFVLLLGVIEGFERGEIHGDRDATDRGRCAAGDSARFPSERRRGRDAGAREDERARRREGAAGKGPRRRAPSGERASVSAPGRGGALCRRRASTNSLPTRNGRTVRLARRVMIQMRTTNHHTA